jgi:hypothetical protein
LARLQSAPAIGAAIGFSLALIGWILAQVAFRLGTLKLNWLAIDYKLFTSFTLIGFGLGAIARFNQLFPDLERRSHQDLTSLLLQPSISVIDSPAVRVEGKLLGRSQSSNALLQDLILETDTGLIRLSYCSQLGAIGNLIPQTTHPCDLIGQSVTVTGWFRRTRMPHIEIDLMRSQTGRTTRGGNQVWSILIALSALSIGLLSIL